MNDDGFQESSKGSKGSACSLHTYAYFLRDSSACSFDIAFVSRFISRFFHQHFQFKLYSSVCSFHNVSVSMFISYCVFMQQVHFMQYASARWDTGTVGLIFQPYKILAPILFIYNPYEESITHHQDSLLHKKVSY